MTTFNTPDEFADVMIGVGGRAYAFVNGELEVEQEADARRVRVFALENPHLGIAESGAAVEAVEETLDETVTDDANESDAPDPEAAALEGAAAPETAVLITTESTVALKRGRKARVE